MKFLNLRSTFICIYLCAMITFCISVSVYSKEIETPVHVYDSRVELSTKECAKTYFDAEHMPMGDEAFHIRIGNNEWILTKSVHRDMSGFYTYDSDVQRIGDSVKYEKRWQCPYCHLFCKWGYPCRDVNCPSKFKG